MWYGICYGQQSQRSYPPHHLFPSGLFVPFKDVLRLKDLSLTDFILNFDFDSSKDLKRCSNIIRNVVASKLDITST